MRGRAAPPHPGIYRVPPPLGYLGRVSASPDPRFRPKDVIFHTTKIWRLKTHTRVQTWPQKDEIGLPTLYLAKAWSQHIVFKNFALTECPWLSFHFSRGQNRNSSSSSFLGISLIRNHTETLAIHLFSEKNIFLRSRGSLENHNLDYNGHNAPVFRAKRQKTAYSLGRLTRT